MPARLRSVPESPPRALGLVRVSKVGDRVEEDLLSPDIQRAAIEDHCARRGYTITGWIEGIDESGSRRKSAWWAKLDGAVSQVEAGDADVLVVWKFSRTARQRLKWAIAIDRVELAGGLLESATEPLDTATASGRLARGMLAEMAAYESEVIGSTWRETHARRTAKGLPASGKPRFGYRVQDGIHRPYPPEAPVLVECYRRYIAGESVYALVGWLNRQGITTVPGHSARGGGPWSVQTLRRVLDVGFGAGYLHVHGERLRGIHEPVIDEATWTAYLAARASRRHNGPRERSTYLLSGMARCAVVLPDGSMCGSSMAAGYYGSQKHHQFRCIAASAARRHPGCSILMRYAEAAVREWVEREAVTEASSADAKVAQRARALRRRQDARALARELVELDKALSRLAVERVRDRAMPGAVWEQARAELLRDRAVLEERRRIALAEAQDGEPAELAAQLARDWDELPMEQLRGGLRRLIARVEVVGARPRSSVRVVPIWAGENWP